MASGRQGESCVLEISEKSWGLGGLPWGVLRNMWGLVSHPPFQVEDRTHGLKEGLGHCGPEPCFLLAEAEAEAEAEERLRASWPALNRSSGKERRQAQGPQSSRKPWFNPSPTSIQAAQNMEASL